MADAIGGEAYNALEAIRYASKFNGWMFDAIRPFINGRILEAGSGIGNMSVFLLKDGKEVWLSDYNDAYCLILANTFSGSPSLKAILPLDLGDEQLEEKSPHLLKSFDTIVATNVIEHIQDDRLAIRNCRKLLKDGGCLVMLVPAYMQLFNNLDQAFGHYRRYTRKTVDELLRHQQQFTKVQTKYFNFAGIAGWFLTGVVLKRSTISQMEMRRFNKLVPVFKIIDRLLMNKVGLSVIALAR